MRYLYGPVVIVYSLVVVAYFIVPGTVQVMVLESVPVHRYNYKYSTSTVTCMYKYKYRFIQAKDLLRATPYHTQRIGC